RVRDSFGNTVTAYVGDITFIAQAGPGTVTGLPQTVAVVNGQASTSNLTSAVAGNVTVRASSGSLATADTSFTVMPVPVTVSITGGPFTYNGNPHAATVTTTPSIAGYSVNYAGTTTAYNSSTPPTNADTYAVTVTITDPNYVLSGSGTGSITITQATPTVSITWAGGIYNGAAWPATGAVTGVGSPAEALGTPSFTYYSGTLATGTPLAGAPTTAGTYTVRGSFGGNTNYTAAYADKTITITQATPVFSNLVGPTITFGATPTALSGKVSKGTLIPTGYVAIALNGVTQQAPIQGDGTFSSSFATGALTV